jgi:hypothetical protein
MKRSNESRCSLEPDFPQAGFLLTFFVIQHHESLGVLPLSRLYRSLDEVMATAEDLRSRGEYRSLTIPETAVFLPARLQTTFPVCQKFGSKPTREYGAAARLQAFRSMFAQPGLHKLLVLASEYTRREGWGFSVATALHRSAETSIAQAFVRMYDYPVDLRAKSGAFYELGELGLLNWQTGELSRLGYGQSLPELELIN